MFEFEDSPPPLNHSPSPSDQSQLTSRDTTPVTPSTHTLGNKKPDRKSERAFHWFKKPIDVGRPTTRLCVDSSPLKASFEDASFPLFGASPPTQPMAGAASQADLLSRQTSTSPRGNQPSTLTSAIQRSNSGANRAADGSTMDTLRPMPQIPQEHSGDMSRFENGARPISMKGRGNDRMRRESLAQSLGTGMSWGGVSVGSFIRDE